MNVGEGEIEGGEFMTFFWLRNKVHAILAADFEKIGCPQFLYL